MPASPSNGDLFAAAPRHAAPVRVGIGGWNYAPWRGLFYPPGLVQRRELEHASRQLRTLEINSTFYRAQPPAVYARWAAQTPADFVFALKAPRRVTEGRRLADSHKAAVAFLDDLQAFGERLGPVSWQFPPGRPFDAGDLAAFLDALPRTLNGAPLRHVLEVRHRSFLCEAYLALMRAHRLPSVFTDSPDYPSFADLTGDFVYARLMRSRSELADGYPADELDQWADRVRRWSAGEDPAELPRVGAPATAGAPREVFVYFISSAKERNPAAAMALQARVDTRR